MGFLGIYRALYDYTPNEDAELAIKAGDLLYILEKNDDDGWWKAKKKAGTDDEDEPTGLIPNNYVEKVCRTLATLPSCPRVSHSPPFHQLRLTTPQRQPLPSTLNSPAVLRLWPSCFCTPYLCVHPRDLSTSCARMLI
jgi:hypothetical protein